MRSKDKWLKDYPMINYKKADYKKIRNSVGEKLKEQKGEVIYMKKRSLKPFAVAGAVLAVSAMSIFTVNAATDGAVMDKVREWTSDITMLVNGEKVEVPAKIKEYGDDYIEFEVEFGDEDEVDEHVIEFNEEELEKFTEVSEN